MGVWSFLLTVSCLFTTPGVIQPGSVIGLGPVKSFFINNITLFSTCLWIVGASLVGQHMPAVRDLHCPGCAL